MSDSYEPGGADVHATQSTGKVDAASHEAADLKDTVAHQAKDVVGTVKDEASTVVGEAKYQVKDLYHQTQGELKDQAATQQQRLAAGLRSVSDELESMASNSDGSGMAGDLVQQVAGRLSRASTWLGDRDPGSVLSEVTRYARRKPGTFILVAAVAGVVAGRLTRALASSASDRDGGSDGRSAPRPEPVAAPALVESDPVVPMTVGAPASRGEARLNAQTASSRSDVIGEGVDVRPDAF